MLAPLPAACLGFTATAEPRRNAEIIHTAIADAVKAKARLLLVPECGLVGYPGAARTDFAGTDWCLVAELEERIEVAATRAGVAVVLGTAGPLGDGRISNDALVVGATAKPARYRKQCLTPGDRSHFIAGGEPCLVDFAGWRLGVAICYDLRFPDVFLRLAAAGADGFLIIAHMAGPDPDPGTKAAVIPALCAVRAAETATPLLFCNTTADDRWLESGHWDARGMRVTTGSGVSGESMLSTLQPRDGLAPWYQGIRREVLERWEKR